MLVRQSVKKMVRIMLHSIVSILLTSYLWFSTTVYAQQWSPNLTSDNSSVVARHETGYVAHGDKLYVMGGRGNRPVQVYDASLNSWITLAPMPVQLHHFQPVVLNNHIYVIGAFTGSFPNERNVQDIYRYDLENDFWEIFGQLPAARLRGSAAAAVYNGKIYLLGGNNSGHTGGFVAWLDEYEPETDTWTTLEDAPNARDHFSLAVVGNKLVAAGGRQTDFSTITDFSGTIAQTDVYDFSTGTWSTGASIPTPRAGNMIGVKNGNLIVMGGESNTQRNAHNEVEAFNVENNIWRSLPSLNSGRHGGAAGIINDVLHAVTGNLVRGGGQETTDHETLIVSDSNNDGIFDFEEITDSDSDGLSDATEFTLGTDPAENDTDSDGLNDGDEVNQHLTDPLIDDTDGDNLSDSEEVNQHLTDPLIIDTDSDGLTDFDELQILDTNPRENDTDNDGLNDGDEVSLHLTDPLLIDSDSDGLSDGEEVSFSTNPNSADSDVDGLSDFDELRVFSTNPSDRDTDGDGLFDQDELEVYDTDPLLTDSDNDGLTDDVEILIHNTDPNEWDSDLDGVSDATEVAEGNDPNDAETGTGIGSGTSTSIGTEAGVVTEVGVTSTGTDQDGSGNLDSTEGNTNGGFSQNSGGGGSFPLTIGFLMIHLYWSRKRKKILPSNL